MLRFPTPHRRACSMGRPSKMMQMIMARVQAKQPPRPSVPDYRICPFTADWHESKQLVCGDCMRRVCERFQALGLDDNEEPLPHSERPLCGAKNRSGGKCQNKVIAGKRRCKFHGGLSTGAKTPEGRQRISEAQNRRWARVRASWADNQNPNFTPTVKPK